MQEGDGLKRWRPKEKKGCTGEVVNDGLPRMQMTEMKPTRLLYSSVFHHYPDTHLVLLILLYELMARPLPTSGVILVIDGCVHLRPHLVREILDSNDTNAIFVIHIQIEKGRLPSAVYHKIDVCYVEKVSSGIYQCCPNVVINTASTPTLGFDLKVYDKAQHGRNRQRVKRYQSHCKDTDFDFTTQVRLYIMILLYERTNKLLICGQFE